MTTATVKMAQMNQAPQPVHVADSTAPIWVSARTTSHHRESTTASVIAAMLQMNTTATLTARTLAGIWDREREHTWRAR